MKTPDRAAHQASRAELREEIYFSLPSNCKVLCTSDKPCDPCEQAVSEIADLFDLHSARLVREELERIVAPVRTSRGPVEPSEITVDTRVRARLKALSDSGGGE